MKPTKAWWVIAILSYMIALYGGAYLLLREHIIPPNLRDSFRARPWGIYPHAFVGMIGLLIGPLQFHPRIQANARTHRRIGTVYVIDALLIGLVGFYMALYSYGGMVTHVGFALLGLLLVGTTAAAYSLARRGSYQVHREWMIRSFALMFAAPTLRIWLPLLIIAYQGEFDPAYRIVAWVSWIPNLIVAEWYIRKTRAQPHFFGGSPL